MGEVVTREKSRESAAACSDPLLGQRRNHLTQREVRVLTGEGKDPFLMLLQWRNASSARHRLRTTVIAKALNPPDRGTDADVKLLGRLPSRSSFLHEANDAHAQFSVDTVHALPNPPANQCVRLAHLLQIGNPRLTQAGTRL